MTRKWQPLLVAAVVVLVLVGGAAVLANARGGPAPGSDPPPLAAAPSQTPSSSASTSRPTIPYVLDRRLYVDGERVPGDWWSVEFGAQDWIAIRTDDTWWWGWGPEAHAIEGHFDVAPVISPNGRYVGEVATHDRKGFLSGFDTRPAGEGLGGVYADLGDRQDGSLVTVRAATDDGRVIAQGSRTGLLWLPLVDNSTVDLTVTAPGQMVIGNTAAGLVVTDGEGGRAYLAELSDTGELTEIGRLPSLDDLVVSPGSAWLAGAAPGSMGGEVTALATLEAQRIDGTERATLTAPDGWGFQVMTWAWEDDRHLVSPVVDGAGDQRLARCRLPSGRCVLIDAP